jgi:hypothetical protein
MKPGDLVKCIYCPLVDGLKPIDYPIFLRVKNETYKLSQSIKDELGIVIEVAEYPHRDFTTNKGKKIHIHFFNGSKWALYKEELALLNVS